VKRSAICFVLTASLAAAFVVRGAQSENATRKTIWSGVYTDAQAERGANQYFSNCSPCHGTDLNGVAHLKGDDFMERWREFDAGSLYDFISKSMPRKRPGSSNAPGSLSENTYLEIISFIFRANNFPAGSQELTAAGMKNIQIEGQDGPKPVPNGALVQLIGCVRRRGADWILTDASEPMRTSVSDSSTPEETTKARAKPLGQLQFTLTNLGYLGGDFNVASYENHRMQTKGYIARQTGRNRISVSALEELAATCP
jgi:hypothetical protein